MSFVPAALAALTITLGLVLACESSPTAAPTSRMTPTTAPTPTPVPVEILVLKPRVVTLKVGQTRQFTLAVLDQFENPILDRDYSYTFTSHRGAGQIDREGRFTAGITAHAYEAAVTVTVTQGPITRTATADVTITPGPLAHVSLQPVGPRIQVGQTQQFTATAFDQHDNPIPGVKVVFDAKSAAGQIDIDGIFTSGTKAAFFEEAITVEVAQGSVAKRDNTYVTITPGPMDRVEISPNPALIEVGSQVRFAALVTDRYGNEISGLRRSWAVDHLGGTIDSFGNYTTRREPGNYTDTIKVFAIQGEVTRSASASVNVVPIEAASVSTGGVHTCALTKLGGVKCWGENNNGQLGDGTTADTTTPVAVIGLDSGAVAVSVGAGHPCALTDAGGVKCWGANWTGQLGDETENNSSTPVDVRGLGFGVTAVSVGAIHTYALTTSGGLKCWGSNGRRKFMDSNILTSLTPVNVTGLDNDIAAVSTGVLHTCALTISGGVKCWGENSSGQLGYGTSKPLKGPMTAARLSTGVAAVSVGYFHTCALTTSGGVKCWGNNDGGQLGDGTTIHRSTPVDVIGLTSGVASISIGSFHSCALTNMGRIKCWGSNHRGQLGNRTRSHDNSTPVDVEGLTNGVTSVSARGAYTCAVIAGGAVKCWGDNLGGQLGSGAVLGRATPVIVGGMTNGAAMVSAGNRHTCAVTTAGGAKCWGSNGAGQLGDGTDTYRDHVVEVTHLPDQVTSIGTGWAHSCALTTIGGVKCWGSNPSGQLGDGTFVRYSFTPVDVKGLTNRVSSISVGSNHNCAITEAGGVKCWGSNNNGQLGDGTRSD